MTFREFHQKKKKRFVKIKPLPRRTNTSVALKQAEVAGRKPFDSSDWPTSNTNSVRG